MLKIENTQTTGWEAAIRGMRNPMNSWAKSDSGWDWIEDPSPINPDDPGFTYIVGPNDLDLMKRLARAGSTDAKYRRMINVTADVTAPLYWWKEYDTYKVGTVANSCSTMHKIHSKEFTFDDFSHEHLIYFPRDGSEIDLEDQDIKDAYCSVHVIDTNAVFSPEGALELTINMLNRARYLFLKTKDKQYWWQMIQLLPSSYNQRRTIQLNYEVLAAIYPKRKNHKLDEWHTFCDWIRSLPYSELITGEEAK